MKGQLEKNFTRRKPTEQTAVPTPKDKLSSSSNSNINSNSNNGNDATSKTSQHMKFIANQKSTSEIVRQYCLKKIDKKYNGSFFKQLHEDLLVMKSKNKLMI